MEIIAYIEIWENAEIEKESMGAHKEGFNSI